MMTVGARALNLIIELSGIILCMMGILQVLLSKVDRRTRRYFIFFYSGLIVLAASNMAGLLMKGLPGKGWRAALYVSNYVEFLMPTVLTYVVTRYLISVVDSEKKQRTLRALLLGLLFLNLIMLTAAQFTGLYYFFDENNVYHRSATYPLAYLVTAVMLCVGICVALRHMDALSQKERITFWIYFAVPVVAIVLQNIQYGINFTIFATIITGLAMYVFIVNDQTERYYQKEQENARLQAEIMLSQIQPHFLYNTLGAIRELCDAPEAKQAVSRFALYLRGNMDALTKSDTIPFAVELEHTKAYLELEQLRFEDALRVEYDITCSDFELPTLTLQPIVENAVRHGARGAEKDVGTVTIATRELPERYEIVVTDDGPGFDPDRPKPKDDGRAHIGIQNVRERLRDVCGGELRIESEIGQGTRAILVLPKKEGKQPC